jgi:hypothetical protein
MEALDGFHRNDGILLSVNQQYWSRRDSGDDLLWRGFVEVDVIAQPGNESQTGNEWPGPPNRKTGLASDLTQHNILHVCESTICHDRADLRDFRCCQ